MPGVYIHIPFCKQACHYCNFHFSTSLKQKQPLLEALIKEIQLTPSYAANEQVTSSKEIISTVYFGGGTPSILTADDLRLLLETLQQRFIFTDDIEITLEANPDDINPVKLLQWLQMGINRLSVGIQSFEDSELQWMNRAHTAAESVRCIAEIKAAGFTNFSIDLIYGSPLSTYETWKRNVDVVTQQQIPHISCYALTVEPRTALHTMIRQQKKAAVDSNHQAEQFQQLMQWMRHSGYEHYEISNFALPGYRSRHNSNYWLRSVNGEGISYYGFGPSAHSYDGIHRRWNIANNAQYIASLQNDILSFEEETLTKQQQLNEYIMTALRTTEGIDTNYIKLIFGAAAAAQLLKNVAKYERLQQVIVANNNIVLTGEGKLFADGIAADLFF
ncbi:MAG: radical SAM family heme chaperone HemW [Bacteroidetes bacterium]|nr:radical SAM family heme chaperone HemW [Bacteroidota bacterium]